jgi:hypothetical protein
MVSGQASSLAFLFGYRFACPADKGGPVDPDVAIGIAYVWQACGQVGPVYGVLCDADLFGDLRWAIEHVEQACEFDDVLVLQVWGPHGYLQSKKRNTV